MLNKINYIYLIAILGIVLVFFLTTNFYQRNLNGSLKEQDNSKIDAKTTSSLKSVKPIINTVPKKEFTEIKNEKDLYEKRDEIINYIWKGKGFPKRIPDKIEKKVKDFASDFNRTELKNVERIDRITVLQEYNVNSIIYHLHPKKKNNKILLYHQGHSKNPLAENEKEVVKSFLEEGYSVMIFYMPLLGQNNVPKTNLTSNGLLDDHGDFALLESEEFSSLKLFLEPIATSINYLEKEYNYQSIHMLGLSGGGWTTVVYSAIDDRIQKSYPIAGSFPLDYSSERDYEQYLPGLKDLTNYKELYVLGSYGKNRKQFQVFNKNDRCCFRGSLYLQKPYEDEIKKTLQKLGKGNFEVYVDDSGEHITSSNSIIRILGKIIERFSRKEDRKEIEYKESEIQEKTLYLIKQDILS